MTATSTPARCQAPSCITPTTGRRPFCEAHWAALPGRHRSRVSLAMGFAWSPVRDEVVQRAVRALPA